MAETTTLFDATKVEKLVFHESVILGGPWGHVRHGLTATLLGQGDYSGEILGEIGMGNEVRLSWAALLPSATAASCFALLNAAVSLEAPYQNTECHTGWYPLRSIKLSTSRGIIDFSSGSQDDDFLPWTIKWEDQELTSSTMALTEAWNLLHHTFQITERTELLFAAWEKSKKPEPPLEELPLDTWIKIFQDLADSIPKKDE